MASAPSTTSRAPIAKRLATWTNNTGGLDLSLRLIHALAIIATQVSVNVEIVKRCAIVASQLTLSRRYLRFFGFFGCIDRVYELLSGDLATTGTLLGTMDLVESSCLGLYFILEDLTMLHDMDVWLVSWYQPILIEAYKFWFYAVAVAITRTLREILLGSNHVKLQEEKSKKKSSKSNKSTPAKPAVSKISLVRRLVVQCCDLTLPGAFVGWTPLSDFGVGMAMLVSTLLVWPDVWGSVQA